MTKKYNFLGIVILLIAINHIPISKATCQTQKVFPLVFGSGTWDMQVYDIALDSSENIGIVGTSKQNKATGEGFYVFMDPYGKVLMQKQYVSTYNGGDEIRFIEYKSNRAHLMGICKDSSANIPFLLILNSDGSIYYHFKAGQFGSSFPTNAVLSNFKIISKDYVIYGYQGDNSGTTLIGMEAIPLHDSWTGTSFPFSGISGVVSYSKYLK